MSAGQHSIAARSMDYSLFYKTSFSPTSSRSGHYTHDFPNWYVTERSVTPCYNISLESERLEMFFLIYTDYSKCHRNSDVRNVELLPAISLLRPATSANRWFLTKHICRARCRLDGHTVPSSPYFPTESDKYNCRASCCVRTYGTTSLAAPCRPGSRHQLRKGLSPRRQ